MSSFNVETPRSQSLEELEDRYLTTVDRIMNLIRDIEGTQATRIIALEAAQVKLQAELYEHKRGHYWGKPPLRKL